LFKNSWRPYLWIAAICLLLYFKALFFNFTYLDDNNLILDNFYFIRNISNIAAAFGQDVFRQISSLAFYYRPLLTVSFIIDAQFNGASPLVFHLTNILLHVLSSCLLFTLLIKMKYRRDLSFFFSLIFAVHPVLSQAVGWIPGRNDSLLMVFALSCFIFFINFFENKNIWSFFLSLIFFALALLTKETALVLIPMFVLYIYLINNDKKITLDKLMVGAGWLLVVVGWYFLRNYGLRSPSNFLVSDGLLSLWDNLPAVIQYLGKIFLPFNLSVLPLMVDTTYIYGIVSLAILIALLAISKTKRTGYLIFGLSWFVLFLIPSFVRPNPQAVTELFEHRVYLPIIGIFIILLETDIVNRFDFKKKSHLIISLMILAVFSAVTFIHLEVFKDRINFWESAAKSSPHSPLAHRNLGAMYYLEGFPEKALPEYQKALLLNPLEPMANNNIGLIYMKNGKLKEAEAEFKREIKINPLFETAYFNLGLLYLNMGRGREGEGLLKKTIELNPEYLDAYRYLAVYNYRKNNLKDAAFYIEELKKRGVEIPDELLYNRNR